MLRSSDQNNETQISDYLQLENSPPQQFKCDCNVCYLSSQRKVHPKKIKQLKPLDFNKKERDYVFILKRLVSEDQRGLRINVPDTCCFIDGKARFIAYTQRERKEQYLGILKFYKNRQSLTITSVRQFMITKKIKVFQNNDQPQQATDKLIPSQMRIRHEIEIKQGKKNYSQDVQDQSIKDIVMVKFKDDNVQVLSDQEFLNLMLKRQVDPIFSQIQYIQSYPKQSSMEIKRISFNFYKIPDQEFYKKARIEIAILNGEISKFSADYTPVDKEEEYEISILREDPIKFLTYLSYKIVHYVAIFKLVQIEKCIFEFIEHEGYFQFYNAFNLKFHNLEKIKINKEITPINPEIFIDEDNDTPINGVVNKELEKKMYEEYEQKKKELGIYIDQFKIPKDNQSDQLFKELYPHVQENFSQLIQRYTPNQILNEVWRERIPPKLKLRGLFRNINESDSIFKEKSLRQTKNINDWSFKPFKIRARSYY